MRAQSSTAAVVSALVAGSALFAGLASAKPLKDISQPRRLHARDQTCYSGVYVIYARGTYEPQNASLSNSVANAITALIPDSASIQVQYPANVSAISPGLGIQNALQQITDYATACPCGKIVLMGYSQGARVIGNALANPNSSVSIPQSIGKNVVSVVQFGDPNRVLGQGVDNDLRACNVSAANPRTGSQYDQINFYADRLNEYCAAGDPVCCATGNDYGQHLGYFTTETQQAVAKYVLDKYNSPAYGCSGASASASASKSAPSRTASATGVSSTRPAVSSAQPSTTASATVPSSPSSTGAASSVVASASKSSSAVKPSGTAVQPSSGTVLSSRSASASLRPSATGSSYCPVRKSRSTGAKPSQSASRSSVRSGTSANSSKAPSGSVGSSSLAPSSRRSQSTGVTGSSIRPRPTGSVSSKPLGTSSGLSVCTRKSRSAKPSSGVVSRSRAVSGSASAPSRFVSASSASASVSRSIKPSSPIPSGTGLSSAPASCGTRPNNSGLICPTRAASSSTRVPGASNGAASSSVSASRVAVSSGSAPIVRASVSSTGAATAAPSKSVGTSPLPSSGSTVKPVVSSSSSKQFTTLVPPTTRPFSTSSAVTTAKATSTSKPSSTTKPAISLPTGYFGGASLDQVWKDLQNLFSGRFY